MSTLFNKLTSRKWWIGAALVLIGAAMCIAGEVENGLKVLCLGGAGYLGAETICDIVRAIFTQETDTDGEESGDGTEDSGEEAASCEIPYAYFCVEEAVTDEADGTGEAEESGTEEPEGGEEA